MTDPLEKLVERFPKLDTLLLPLLLIIAGIFIYFFIDKVTGLSVITFAIGTNADLRYKAKTWLMKRSPELRDTVEDVDSILKNV